MVDIIERSIFLKNLFYDGFNSELIETAFFDGIFEILILKAPSEIVLPTVAVPTTVVLLMV